MPVHLRDRSTKLCKFSAFDRIMYETQEISLVQRYVAGTRLAMTTTTTKRSRLSGLADGSFITLHTCTYACALTKLTHARTRTHNEAQINNRSIERNNITSVVNKNNNSSRDFANVQRHQLSDPDACCTEPSAALVATVG
jgi:hypothetical protein